MAKCYLTRTEARTETTAAVRAFTGFAAIFMERLGVGFSSDPRFL
jgi:hypothetical protein